MKRFWALLLALAMLSGPCAFAEETAAPVFAVGELSGNFNPFFAEAEGDRLVAQLANGSLRMSLDESNTYEDIDYAVDTLKEIVNRLREMSPLYADAQRGVYVENSDDCKFCH